jgi:hypothetical protein
MTSGFSPRPTVLHESRQIMLPADMDLCPRHAVPAAGWRSLHAFDMSQLLLQHC